MQSQRQLDNLLAGNPPTQFRAGREQVETARAGGVASGEARRRRKALAEIAEAVVNSGLEPGSKVYDSVRRMASALDEEDLTVGALMVTGQANAAAHGNANAMRVMMELVGQAREPEAEGEALDASCGRALRGMSGKQHELATWWCAGKPTAGLDGVVAEGAIRSGKTWAMACGFLLWSRESFRGQSFIIAGRSVGALKRNVVAPMTAILRDVLGWDFEYSRSEGVLTTGGNRYYLFGATNEASQDVLQGLTAAGCLADEVALFPESFVAQMVGRCSVEGSKLWFNCNPSYPSHFFKTGYIDRAGELNLHHMRFLMEDNPTLAPEVRERYERMFSGVYYDRYVLGLWTMAEGLVYPDYRAAVEEPWRGEAARWAVSCDYGTQNAFAALLWAYDGAVWHAVREYRYSGRDEGHQKTDADYVADMRAFLAGAPGDAPFIIDPSAASFIAAMRRAGFKVRKADNAVEDGIRETAAAMQQGLVKIGSCCEGTLREFAGYVWDEKAGCDRPVKRDDHCMDALRYFVKTMRAAKPPSPGYESVFR